MPAPPYSGGPHHAHEAHLAELGEDLARELLALVPLARVRAQLALRELSDRFLEELLLLAEAEIQRQLLSVVAAEADGTLDGGPM